MSAFNSTKSIKSCSFLSSTIGRLSTLGLITISHLTLANSAHGFSVTFDNGGFESDIVNSQNSWNTIGDVTTSPTIDGISPTDGSSQAIITTGHLPGTASGTARDDDNGLTFNQSGNNPVNADTNTGAELQDYFGFNANAFSIDRSVGAMFPGTRTSKEGSGMFQDFSVTLDAGETSFSVSFDWAFLSNDGTTSLGGDQDFAFWSLGQYDAGTDTFTTAFSGTGNPDDQIMVLQSSSSSSDIEGETPPDTVDDYLYESDYVVGGRETYTVTGLIPGQTYNYRLGYGVVDVDTLERTSALLIDNARAVPFDFSPTLGLFFVGGFFGVKKYLTKKRV